MDDKKQIEELIKACGKLAGSLDFTISVLQKLASEDCEKRKDESLEDYLKTMAWQMEENDRIFRRNVKKIDFYMYGFWILALILIILSFIHLY